MVPDQEGAFHVTDDALAILRSIDIPIAPVAVAGRYRTGKSFLLNCLVQDKSGFEVGPTIEACTHGIWLWSEPHIVESNGQRTAVLFVDTEGLGANSSDVQHDSRVFALATLLCSVLIYNSVGTIDEEAISQLSFVAQLSRHIEGRHPGASASAQANASSASTAQESDVDSDEDDSTGRRPAPSAFREGRDPARDQFFPTFLWVVRDFSLTLSDPETGEPLTAKEYLETSLASQPGYASDVQARNRVRRALTSYFKRRDCMTLVRPVDEEEDLPRLDTIPWTELRPEFRLGMDSLRARVLKDLALPKLAEGTPVTGRVLALLAQQFVRAINEGGVPSIQGAWEASTKLECEAALTAGKQALEQGLAAELHASALPMDVPELQAVWRSVCEVCMRAFNDRAVGPAAESTRAQLKTKIDAAWTQVQADNNAASEKFCGRLASKLWAEHVDAVVEQSRAATGAAAGLTSSGTAEVDAVAAAIAAFKAEYLRSARGPALHKALSLCSLDSVPSLVRGVVSVRTAHAAAHVAAMDAQLAKLRENLETTTARASVYEQQCADLRREKTSGTVDKARAEAAAKVAKEEVERLQAQLEELEEEKKDVESQLADEKRAHAAARIQLRQSGSPLADAMGTGAVAGVNPSSITAGGLSPQKGRSTAGGLGSSTLSIDPDVDRKYRQRLMPAGAEHIAAPGHAGSHPLAHALAVKDGKGTAQKGGRSPAQVGTGGVDFPDAPPPGGCGPGCVIV